MENGYLCFNIHAARTIINIPFTPVNHADGRRLHLSISQSNSFDPKWINEEGARPDCSQAECRTTCSGGAVAGNQHHQTMALILCQDCEIHIRVLEIDKPLSMLVTLFLCYFCYCFPFVLEENEFRASWMGFIFHNYWIKIYYWAYCVGCLFRWMEKTGSHFRSLKLD